MTATSNPGRRLNVACFGFFDALNAGDERIRFALTKLFDGHTVQFFKHQMPPPPRGYLRSFDLIVIGGGGLVFAASGIWVGLKRWLRRAGRPVLVLGLGINRMPPVLEEGLEWLAEHATAFHVRDAESRRLLGEHRRVTASTDLTWLVPLRPLADHPGTGLVINLLDCTWKPYSAQEWSDALADEDPVGLPFDLRSGRDADVMRAAGLVKIAPEFRAGLIERAGAFIGCRYHGLLFAAQLGVPFIAINYDFKVERFMREAGLDQWMLETDAHDSAADRLAALRSATPHLKVRYAQARGRHEQLADHLRSEVTELLQDIAG